MVRRKDRFYNVVRGIGRGRQAAKDFYIEYLKGLTPESDMTGEGTARPPKIKLYLEPFAFDLAVDHVMEESALQPSWTALGGISPTGTYVTPTLGSKIAVTGLRSYAAPRISRRIITGGSAIRRSKFTNQQYRRRNGSSQSIPFGKNNLSDTVQEVFGTLRAAYLSGNPAARVTLIPERV